MGRIFGILFIVLAVWTGVEVYTEGFGGAFGGLVARLGWAEPESPPPVPERAARAFEDAYRASEERVRRQLE
jgi:hypothetical protein